MWDSLKTWWDELPELEQALIGILGCILWGLLAYYLTRPMPIPPECIDRPTGYECWQQTEHPIL